MDEKKMFVPALEAINISSEERRVLVENGFGGAPERVTTDDTGEEWRPVYSPMGTRLMYTRYVYGKDRNDFTTQVYIILNR